MDRINPHHKDYQKIASYGSMKTYRDIWNNMFNYLKEHWKLTNFEFIEAHHVVAYMDYKIEYYPSKQYLEKISSAIGKLELALIKFAKNIHNENRLYDFSIRQTILNEARNMEFVANNYHNRTYNNPELLIDNLSYPLHKLVANIQYQGGARIEGVALIKEEQLRGITFDKITNTNKGSIWTKEKGGKEGLVLINIDTYQQLVLHIKSYGYLKIDKQKYWHDIKQTSIVFNEVPEASHGLRWNFAKRRMFEYGKAGYSYDDCLQYVSWEMKHNRPNITKHYLG